MFEHDMLALWISTSTKRAPRPKATSTFAIIVQIMSKFGLDPGELWAADL
jgi:hypothetical protein